MLDSVTSGQQRTESAGRQAPTPLFFGDIIE